MPKAKSFLVFVDITARFPTLKTRVWQVQSTNGVALGTIGWFPAWRRYTFSPILKCVFDVSCQREIADFMEARMDERKR